MGIVSPGFKGRPRSGREKLPPGQYLTEKWPVLHAGTVPRTDLATWDFRIFGEVEEPIALSYDELQFKRHIVKAYPVTDKIYQGV